MVAVLGTGRAATKPVEAKASNKLVRAYLRRKLMGRYLPSDCARLPSSLPETRIRHPERSEGSAFSVSESERDSSSPTAPQNDTLGAFLGANLERKPRPKLNLAARMHRHRYRAELRGVDKAVRSSQIRVIERIKELRAKLQAGALGDPELPRQGQVEQLHTRTFHRIAAEVAELVGGRSGKCS